MADNTDGRPTPRRRRLKAKAEEIAAPAHRKAAASPARKQKQAVASMKEWQHHPYAVHALRTFDRGEVEGLLTRHKIDLKPIPGSNEPDPERAAELERALAQCEAYWLRFSTAPNPTAWRAAFRRIELHLQAILEEPDWALANLQAGIPAFRVDMRDALDICLQEARHHEANPPKYCRSRGKKWGSIQGVLLHMAIEPLWRRWMPDRGGCQKHPSKDNSLGVAFLEDAARLLGWNQCRAPSFGENRHDVLQPSRGAEGIAPDEGLRFDMRVAAYLNGYWLEDLPRKRLGEARRSKGGNREPDASFTHQDKPKDGA